MFRRIVFVAALAGLIAGVFVTAAQAVRVIPLILEAETYEASVPASDHAHGAVHDHDHGAAHGDAQGAAAGTHHHGEDAWAPEDGVERMAYTLLTNVLASIGFGLLLAAAFALRGGADWRSGLYWGLAGFATFTLAPALGLPPEIPGAEAAPLLDRQLWWVGAVLATGGGLALLFLVRRPVWMAAGAALLVLPHLIGAPQPEAHGGLAPESLARDFVVAALVTSFLFWLVLGSLTGFFYKRLAAA